MDSTHLMQIYLQMSTATGILNCVCGLTAAIVLHRLLHTTTTLMLVVGATIMALSAAYHACSWAFPGSHIAYSASVFITLLGSLTFCVSLASTALHISRRGLAPAPRDLTDTDAAAGSEDA